MGDWTPVKERGRAKSGPMTLAVGGASHGWLSVRAALWLEEHGIEEADERVMFVENGKTLAIKPDAGGARLLRRKPGAPRQRVIVPQATELPRGVYMLVPREDPDRLEVRR